MSLRNSVFGLSSSLVGLLRTRLELLGLELSSEKSRLIKLLCMAFASLLFLTLAVLVFTVTIAVAFWPNHLALGLLAAIYGVIGLLLLCLLRRALNHDVQPFVATLEELGRDAALLMRVREAQQEQDERGAQQRRGD